jgi:protein HIRA/HIR1
MSNHNGAVTVVRFSPNGQYLASGSDDRIVLIWEKDDQRVPRQEFGSQGEADTEAWVARKRLIGHDNDVQDLAWSPDGSILVTVGLDSAIIIWSGSTFEKLKRFDAHQSHVKGITFDPANKYFATASDDRTVRIVRYHKASGSDMTFNIEATISVPFEGSPLSTYFRRCSWSPDGNHIAAANATNGPVATVAIINRGTWDSEISLIGHDAPCEVASFSPRVFTAEKPEDRPKEGEPNTITVIATAAQDKTLAVWNTTHPRPLVVAHNVADKAITDIVWTADGRSLFASSLDGTILVATFEDGELGYPMSAEEVETQLSRYGGTKDTMQIPESVEQISLEEKLATEETPTPTTAATATATTTTATATATATTAATAAATTTTTVGAQNEGAASTHASTSGPSSRLEELLGPSESTQNGFNQISNNLQQNTSASSTNETRPSAAAGNGRSAPQQKVTITKEGKKRVAPMLISSSSNKPSAPPAPRAPQSAESNIEVMEMSKPSYALPRGGVNSMIIGSKRKPDEDNEDGEITAALNTTHKKSKQEEVPEFIKPAVVCPASTVAQVRLATPKVRTFFSSPSASDTRSTALEVRNGSGNEQEPTRIIATKRGQVLFIDFLPRHGHLASGTGDLFWAVATEDGSIYIYSPNGRRLMPCIVLGSSLTFLESQGPYLLAITSTGMMHIWNIEEQRALHTPASLAPILDNGTKYMENGIVRAPSVTQCGVTETGHAVLTLSNGAGFTYNSAMLSWHRISDSWWTFGSQYWDSSGRSNASGGIIGMVERRTNEEVIVKGGNRGRQLQRMAKNRMMQEGYEGFEGVVSIAHLENRIGACIMLGSNREFEQFMVMYAEKLAEEGMTDRVDELCKNLLGPSVLDDKSQWNPQVCSINKHDLLRTIVQRIARYREVQRVVNDYAQLLDI